jgi:periplasmic divalent cation tolerance protein
MSEFIQIITTIDTREAADRLAHSLVSDHLAGCVQIVGPIKSTYWWEGEIETSEEWLCLIKTLSARYAQLEEAIRRVHPYEIPEILAVPIDDGSQSYLQWLGAQVY